VTDAPERIRRIENEDVRMVRFVPQSRAWERFAAANDLHLLLLRPLRRGRLRRAAEQFLCGRDRGWFTDPDERALDHAVRCPRCADLATRYGIDWPVASEVYL
jgi:hypothetical protein